MTRRFIKTRIIIQRLVLIAFVFLISCSSNREISKKESLLDKLEQLNYFKYCSKEELEKLKSLDLEETFNSKLIFEYYDDNESYPLTKRNYLMDGEYVSDLGGIKAFIKTDLSPFYKASGFKLDLTKHIIEFDTVNHTRLETLYVNDRKYEIFKNDFVRWGESWYIAPVRIAEMINSELELQNFEEQFYLINSENDLSGSFLSPAQCKFFKNQIADPYWQPHSVENWKKIYNLKL